MFMTNVLKEYRNLRMTKYKFFTSRIIAFEQTPNFGEKIYFCFSFYVITRQALSKPKMRFVPTRLLGRAALK